MAFVDLATGSEFGGRYRVVRRLASGGMGTVYEVVHRETERPRALKVMQSDLFQNASLRERFRNEARVTAKVRSDFLVDVFDAGVDAATGMPFLVMELLIGEDLGRRVERLGPLSPREVVAYLGQVASALDKTHAASIVHRDLKPANLFLAELEDGSSRMKILDFGISKIVSEATSDGATSRTLGTPAYMAPEQLLGEPVSAATDIHALGLIAYTLLVGESYWQEDVESVDNVFAFALRAQEGPREDALVRAARQGHPLPAAFGAWFERATARDPAARFARATLATAALAETLGVRAGPGASVSASHSMSVDAPGIRAERSRLSGFRWLALPLLALGILALFGVFSGPAPGADDVPAKAVPAPRSEPRASAAAATLPAAASASPAPAASASVQAGAQPSASPSRGSPSDQRSAAARARTAPRTGPPPAARAPASAQPEAAPALPPATPPSAPLAPARAPQRYTRD